MKVISSALQSHLDQDATTLARCWKIVRTDGTVFGFTTADIPITLPTNSFTIVQSGTYEQDAPDSVTTVLVPLPQPATAGNLLVAFFHANNLDGTGTDDIINTTDWMIEARTFSGGNSACMWILSRYATISDGVAPPSLANSTLSEFSYVSASIQEISGVTGVHSTDVPYAHVSYGFDVSTLVAGSFTSATFPFAVVGYSVGAGAGAVTLSAGLSSNINKVEGVYEFGCANGVFYTPTVAPSVTTQNGSVDNFVGMIGMNVPAVVYEPAQGFQTTAMEAKDDLSVDNLEIEGIFNSGSITIQNLRAGKFNYADVFLYVVNWADVTQGVLNLRRGKLGEVVASPQGWFKVELRGMTQLLQQLIVELYGPECRADLGDSRCTIPIDPPVWRANTSYNPVVVQVNTGAFVKAIVNANTDYSKYGNVIFQCTTLGQSGGSTPTWNLTIGGTTTDGTVVWTTVGAWTRTGTVGVVADELDFAVTWDSEDSRDVDTWYQYGILVWDTGQNAGLAQEVKQWTKSSETITLYFTTYYPISTGDRFHVSPGCDKSLATCRDKFANLLNMRAEPYLPGNDFVFYYPNANGPGAQV